LAEVTLPFTESGIQVAVPLASICTTQALTTPLPSTESATRL
jgi:hypothetical protein